MFTAEENRLKKELKLREEEEKNAEKHKRKEAKQQASGKDAASMGSDSGHKNRSQAVPAAAVVDASDKTQR